MEGVGSKNNVMRYCIVAGNKNYSGYGNVGGPTGQTGAEVTYQGRNVLKTGEVMLVKDKRAKHYLHPVPGTPGSDLGAGLFKKRADISGKETVLDER